MSDDNLQRETAGNGAQQLLAGPFQHSQKALALLMTDPELGEAVRAGKPLRDHILHLPVLDNSKRTVNALLENIRTEVEGDGLYQLANSQGEVDRWGSLLQGQPSVAKVALINAVPESIYGGDTGALSRLIRMPGGAEGLTHAVLAQRERGEDMTSALSAIKVDSVDEATELRRRLENVELRYRLSYLSVLASAVLTRAVGDTDFLQPFETVSMDTDILGAVAAQGGFEKVFEADRGLEDRLNTFYRKATPEVQVRWSAPIPSDLVIDGYTFHALTSTDEIKALREAMGNDIGNNVGNAYRSAEFLFSVSGPDGEVISTLELMSINPFGDEFEVSAHAGKNGTEPPRDVLAAGESFLEGIHRGRYPFEDFHAHVEDDHLTLTQRGELTLGAQYSDPRVVRQAVEDLQVLVPAYDPWPDIAAFLTEREPEGDIPQQVRQAIDDIKQECARDAQKHQAPDGPDR